MSIYVSELFSVRKSKDFPEGEACYLVSTTEEELLKEAECLKIDKSKIKKDENGILHMLLIRRKRRRAVDRGAHEISLEKLISKKKDWAS